MHEIRQVYYNIEAEESMLTEKQHLIMSTGISLYFQSGPGPCKVSFHVALEPNNIFKAYIGILFHYRPESY